MEIDWIVSVVVFLMFLIAAFSYYFSLYPELSILKYKTDIIAEKLINFLKPEGYRVPIEYISETAGNRLIYFYFKWPFGKQTTRIYSGSSRLPCQIMADRVYFQANVVEGKNYFTMRFSDENTTGCNANLSLSNITMAKALAMEREDLISESRLNEMFSMEYEKFNSFLGIEGDFRIEIDGNVYGPNPSESAVGKEFSGRIRETGKNIEIRILAW